MFKETKLVPEIIHLSYPNRLKALKLPTLSYQRVRGDMIEVYKILHGMYDVINTTDGLLNLRNNDVSPNLRDHRFTLEHIRINTETHTHFFGNSLNRVTKIWNTLPEMVVWISCGLIKIYCIIIINVKFIRRIMSMLGDGKILQHKLYHNNMISHSL